MRNWVINHFPSAFHPLLRQVERRSHAAIGSALRVLPGDSAFIGPPRGWVSHLRDHSEYTEVFPANLVKRCAPCTIESVATPAFLEERLRYNPSVGVGQVRGGRVYTNMGAVITADDKLIFDVSHTGGSDNPAEHPIFSIPKLPTLRDGGTIRIAVLTTYPCNIAGHPFYGHWLLDTLPRFHLLQESGVQWDQLLIPNSASFQAETLQLLGLCSDELMPAPDSYIRADWLIVPSLPAVIGNTPRWACQFLRNSFLPFGEWEPRGKGRRLYISREKTKWRKVLNEDVLVDALRKRGFEKVFLEGLSFTEQVGLMRSAAAIVSPHSTALANLVFCDPGTKVLEILPPNYLNVCWYSLADQVDLVYGYALGEGPVTMEHFNRADIVADITSVNATLDAMSL